MGAPRNANATNGPVNSPGRELFGTRIGFVLAAAGSAVGLGNMWRFPYQTAEGGGAAFVLVYLFMTFLIGVPLMVAEFAVGRRTRLSPVGALRTIGGRGWTAFGFVLVATPLLLLSYFSVVSGWSLRYAIDALRGFSASPGERYAEISHGFPAVLFHLVMMAVTIWIVMGGVRKGIERAGLVLMPILFLILIGLVVWAATLAGSGPGYSFYLRPSFEAVLNPTVLRGAASQAFLSLSVGMGIMITYASYLSRQENINREAIVVSLFDFSVAFTAGMVVFPVIFALGLSGQVGESTMGALFISLPGGFAEMGAVGRLVGFAFFLALVLAGLTSSVSLLEVVVASIMDEFGKSRKAAAVGAGLIATTLGVVPAMSQNAFGIFDKVSGELMVVAGVLGMAILVGWKMKDPLSELREGASPVFRRIAPGLIFMLRYVVPPLTAVVLWYSMKDTIALIFG